MAEQPSSNQSVPDASSSPSVPAGATDDGEEWTTVARPSLKRNESGNRGAHGTKRPFQQSASAQPYQQNNWRDGNGASAWNRSSNNNSRPNSTNHQQQQRQPQHFQQPAFNRPQGQHQQQQPLRWGGGNNTNSGNFQQSRGSNPAQHFPASQPQNPQQTQAPNSEPLDPKPFAQALYALVNQNAHGASEPVAATPVESVADSSSPSPSGGAAAASYQSAVPPYLSPYIRNFSPFISNNPFLSPSTFVSGWPAARFASHTIRGLVYRNQSMQAHGSIAIYQIDGVMLEEPIFVWGNVEMNRPQKRFDSPAMVDFGTFLNSSSSSHAAYRYHLYKPQNGRLYTIFKYAVNGVDFPCIKSLGNSPFWKIEAAPDNSNIASANQQRGFTPSPPAQQSNNSTNIVLDGPAERLFAYLRELKLIPIPPSSNTSSRSISATASSATTAPTVVADSMNGSPPPPPLTLARSQSGQIRYSAPLAPWASPTLAKTNSPPITPASAPALSSLSAVAAAAGASATTTSTLATASTATNKPAVVKSTLNPTATAWGPSAARVFPSSTPSTTAAAATHVTPAPPALRSAFDQLWLDSSLQSLTFEWSGNNMGPDQADNIMVTPTYPNRIMPLFFQTRTGETILVDSSFSSTSSPYASSSVEAESGEFRGDNLAQLHDKLKSILDKAEAANEAHREKRHMLLEEEPQHFVDIGRFMFFTPSTTTAVSSSSTSPATLRSTVVNRMGFSLLPGDYERATNECRFSASLQSAIRDALASLKSDGSLARVHLTGMWPAWLLKELQRRVLARGISYGRYSAVRLNAEAFAKTVATFQPLHASSGSSAASSVDASSKKPKKIQRMLILVAFPGAGKSYFSERLLAVSRVEHEAFASQQSAAETSSTYELDESASNASSRPIQWVRINQDTMGSRRSCEIAAERALNAGSSVIIDRTNIDYSQRANWVNMARKFRLDEVECVLLNMPVNVCKQRVLDRVNHETLPSTNASLSIVDRFLANYAPPILEEGFTRMHQIDYFEDEAVRESHMAQLVQQCNRRR